MRPRNVAVIVLLAALGGGVALLKSRSHSSAVAPGSSAELGPAQKGNVSYEVAEEVFRGGFQNGWQYWGFGEHELPQGAPAKVSFETYGGFIVVHEQARKNFGALGFRYKAPSSFGQFLKVSLKTTDPAAPQLPVVSLDDSLQTALPDGWYQVWVPFSELNPASAPFNRIAIEGAKLVSKDWVEIDGIALAKPQAGSAGARAVTLKVQCKAEAPPISPLIYGIRADDMPGLGEAAHRIGGNTMSRLNWDLGNVWNTGNDWFFENVKGDSTVWDWLAGARKVTRPLAMTVPTLGWVAKDATSAGFPVSKLGAQQKADPQRPDAGNGLGADGRPLTPLAPTQTSVAAGPELIKRWLEKVREGDRQAGARAVHMYILDNEPSLWSSTHRDVHPEPLGYDELLDRTLRYAAVIREVDADALIAGPAEWGWSAYFDSAKDLASKVKSDKLLHGGQPLIAWYLKKLQEHEQKTGQRLLDVLDLHYYPQAPDVYSAKADPETTRRRLRSTRSLWDSSYEDESWIKDRVNLLPRMRGWVQENYPGRKLSLGEWSFGAEQHIGGGLALAEALGRFGQQGLYSAFLWGKLAPGTPGFLAFSAFRNFDGKGATFEAFSVPAQSGEEVSLFVSRDSASKRYVAVLLNLSLDSTAQVSLDLSECDAVVPRRSFGFSEGSKSLESLPASKQAGSTLTETLPPLALRVLELEASSGASH